MPILLLLLLAATVLGSPLASQTLTAPIGYAASAGTSNNTLPWGRDANSMRIQFVYDSSNFSAQTSPLPLRITQLRFRPAAVSASTAWAGGSWPNIRIDLATCPLDYLAPSPAFVNNLGPDVQQVYQGPVTVLPGAGQGTGVLLPDYIVIPLQAPFVYDPTQGDLTVDIRLDGSGWTGGSTAADHVAGSAALGSRIFNTANATAASGTIGTQFIAVCAFDYTLAIGVIPQFTATPVRGPAPLQVQFTDHSFSAASAGVTGWAWDFDNDGVVDSTQRNPSWTFAGCGDFTVSLTALDGVNPPVTETKVAFVRTDEIVCSFTSSPTGSGAWQMTDTTSPPATGWAWDVDADGTIDSTLQNPVFTLGNACSRTIRLLATRSCRTSAHTSAVLMAPAAQSASLLAGTGNSSPTTMGNCFDVQVLAAEGVTVCGITTASYLGVGPFRVDVYVTPGSYVGKDATIDAWRLAATGTGAMAGGSVMIPSLNTCALNPPLHLPNGDHGLAVYVRSTAGPSYLAYTNASWGPFGNGDMVLHPFPSTAPGVARNALFGGMQLLPRQWNGTLHYTKVTMNGHGGHGLFALGCPGSIGVPGNVAAHPVLGAPFTATLSNLAQNTAIYWWGSSRVQSSLGSLPLSLAPLGAPGCRLFVSLDASVALIGSAGSAVFQLTLPGSPGLLGLQLYSQAASFDPGANPFGVATSDAAVLLLGN